MMLADRSSSSSFAAQCSGMASRRAEALIRLENKKWLAARLRSASVREIARELGVAPDLVLRSIFRHGLDVEHRARGGKLLVPRHRLSHDQRKRLEDCAWLER